MSDQTKEQIRTNVTGYYNPNTWPIHVAISECNVGVTLQPNEFILDRHTQKKINDPLLERYCGPKMLAQETSPDPVPVLELPVITSIKTSNSGYVVGQGGRDANGKLQTPTQSNPMPDNAPPESRASISAMTMEEARERGLVGKARVLPEDYGAPETDGAPTRGDAIPKMKYSMESRPKVDTGGELPPELTEGVQPQNKPLLDGLRAQAAQNLEKPDLSRKAAEAAVAEQQGAGAVKEFRAAKKQVKKAQPVEPQPAPTPTEAKAPEAPKRKRRVATVQEESAPAPVAPAPVSPAPVSPPEPQVPLPPQVVEGQQANSPLVGGSPDLPPPDLEGDEPKSKSKKAKEPVVCPVCNQSFDYKSWYKRHVKRHHPDQAEALLKAP